MPSLLIVCTANICRSPMAAGLLKLILTDHAKTGAGSPDNWRIESAGTWGMDGEPAASGTQQVLAERGLDISAHRARTVTRSLIRQFDLILTMESGHKEALGLEFPEARSRIYLVSEMIGHQFDIPDPMGQPVDRFRSTAREFEHIFRSGLDRIIQLAEARNAPGGKK